MQISNEWNYVLLMHGTLYIFETIFAFKGYCGLALHFYATSNRKCFVF